MINDEKKKYALSVLVDIYKRHQEEQKQERRWGWLRRLKYGAYVLKNTVLNKTRLFFYRLWRWIKGGSFWETPEDKKIRLGWVVYEECGFGLMQDYALSRVGKE